MIITIFLSWKETCKWGKENNQYNFSCFRLKTKKSISLQCPLTLRREFILLEEHKKITNEFPDRRNLALYEMSRSVGKLLQFYSRLKKIANLSKIASHYFFIFTPMKFQFKKKTTGIPKYFDFFLLK